MATIINAVLVNLCSSSPVLRAQGYQLLDSLNRSYRIEGLEDLRGRDGDFEQSRLLSPGD